VNRAGRAAADSECAQFGVEFGDRVGDLLGGVLVAEGFAFGVSGEQIRPGGHQRLLLFGRFCSLGDRFCLQVPALAALRHPQPSGLVCTWSALVVSGGPARNGNDVDTTGGGLDAAHGQRADAYAVLFGQGLGDVGADGQGGPLSLGRPGAVEGGEFGGGHAAPPWVDPPGPVGLVGKGSTAVLWEVGPVTKVSSCLIVLSGTQPARMRKGSRMPSPKM